MGTWKLETFKMTLYTMFPVVLFFVFNQPAYYEEWVTKTRREIMPPENKDNKAAIKKLIQELKKREIQVVEEN